MSLAQGKVERERERESPSCLLHPEHPLSPQVLLSQGGQVPMNSQHLSQLQQYYNSLGHLQDDAYVIEAPSFIVPYVMEGKPKVLCLCLFVRVCVIQIVT